MKKKLKSPSARARMRRKASIRKKIKGTPERPRLCVFRSNKHIYAQVIDDLAGAVLVTVSSLAKEVREQLDGLNKTEVAKKVGEIAGEKCKAANIERVVFDRNGYPYAGRVTAVADGAREAGLIF